MVGRKPGSSTPAGDEVRFITRRLEALRLASNGPGTPLPCRLESLDSLKHDSALFKMSSVIHNGSVCAFNLRGTARQQSCCLNGIKKLNWSHCALNLRLVLHLKVGIAETSAQTMVNFEDLGKISYLYPYHTLLSTLGVRTLDHTL